MRLGQLNKHYQQGFTLMELIIVIVILGVVAISTSRFIGFSAEIYTDGNRRAELVAQARFVLLRLEKELHNALPNSISITTGTDGPCLSYYPIIVGGTYLGEPTDTPLRVIDQQDVLAEDTKLIIYPRNSSSGATDAVNINAISQPDTSKPIYELTLSSTPTERSPGKRYYVVGEQVSICQGTLGSQGTLVRTQGASGVLVTNVAAWQPTYLPGTLQRNALVNISLTLQSSSGESLALSHEVHVPNVP